MNAAVSRTSGGCVARWLLLPVVLWGTSVAGADQPTPDAVEALRQAVERASKAPPPDAAPPGRPGAPGKGPEQELLKYVDAVHGLRDLSRALDVFAHGLGEPPPGAPAVPGQPPNPLTAARNRVIERFVQEARRVLTQGPVSTRLGVLTLVAELGPTARGAGYPEIGAGLAPDVARLAREEKEADLRQAAARALGRATAAPDVVVPPLEQLLGSADVADRRAAAEGLESLADRAARPGTGQEGTSDRPDTVRLATTILPLARRALGDPDVEVRRRGAAVIARLGTATRQLLPNIGAEPELRDERQLQAALKEFEPLLRALKEHAAGLVPLLEDRDATVCIAASEALERLAELRLGMRTLPAGARGAAGADPLDEALRAAVPGLARELANADVRARLAALYVLETIGELSAPAAAAVIAATQDKDAFVRWGAARVCTVLAPQAADQTVPALARLLADASGEVRLTAAGALRRYAAAAAPAVPDLRTAVKHTDAGTRIAALAALAAVGKDAATAIPDCTGALTAPDAEVRRAAAVALGAVGPLPASATEALRKALHDPDAAVRRAAGEALLGKG